MAQLLERPVQTVLAVGPRVQSQRSSWIPALLLVGGVLGAWALASFLGWFPAAVVPSPLAVARAFAQEVASGRLSDDIVASLFRVAVGFTLAVVLAVPCGLILGTRSLFRSAFLPAVNFLRSISPIAWIPFAILWFGIGDLPAIFIIFLSSFLPLTLSILSAVASVPAVYFRVAEDYGLRGSKRITRVLIPAILPQLITALRVSSGIAWMVVVAAEMIAVRDGLGFLILDARNGLRMDLVVTGMLVIGLIGIALDRLLAQLSRLRSVRWGYES